MPRLAITALVLVFAATSASADGWRFASRTAGFATSDGAFAGLWLACDKSGSARLVVSTGNTRLETGTEQTVVVTIDGTALMQRMRAGSENGGPVVYRQLAPAEAGALAARLAKGATAEVATPAGRFLLPLKGSGKALEGLRAACG